MIPRKGPESWRSFEKRAPEPKKDIALDVSSIFFAHMQNFRYFTALLKSTLKDREEADLSSLLLLDNIDFIK